MEALIGVKLPPRALAAIVSGCVNDATAAADGEQFGTLQAVTAGGDRVFVSNASGAWRVAAGQTSAWLIDYQSYSGAWPSRVRLTSRPGQSPAVALTLTASQVDINRDLPASSFALAVPADYTPLTLDELRAGGPLREKRRRWCCPGFGVRGPDSPTRVRPQVRRPVGPPRTPNPGRSER